MIRNTMPAVADAEIGRVSAGASGTSQPVPSGIATLSRQNLRIRENNVSIQDSVPGPGFARRRVAIAVSLALSAAAQAQNSTEETKTLPKVSVEAEEETINVKRVASPKFTQDLVDTPQTIAVVSREVLGQQGATTLSQALRNTPGVTFLLGENGNTA